MAIKITLFITLLMYAVVISQSFFYILAMSMTLKKMRAQTYIETRNLLTTTLQEPLQIIYYTTQSASVQITAFCVVYPGGLLSITSLTALVALLAVVVLALKGKIPLNKSINCWTTRDFPDN